jgi:PleD family two-component response regulator
MILAAVEDLLFSSRIRSAAKAAGVEVKFVRSRGALLDEIRTHRPHLVIFDVNAAGLAPLETAAAMRADAELADVPTVGFVSHVQVDLIEAARRAGIGEVMARSMFVMRLPDLMASGRS